ncbi:MAG: hypothetical protein MZV63_67770 [Marinilabiliales bacterium]|nr:hypothetical protein [Marinilabiliales bacterium]
MDKRLFIKSAGFFGIGTAVSMKTFAGLVASVSSVPATDLAAEEDFWLTA